MTEKTFWKITNKDIYDKIENFYKENTKAHDVIMKKQDMTNGKVKLANWASTTAIAIVVILMGFLFQHMSAIK